MKRLWVQFFLAEVPKRRMGSIGNLLLKLRATRGTCGSCLPFCLMMEECKGAGVL